MEIVVITLKQKPNRKNLIILFIVSFLIRAATFQFFVQHKERYKQPDSMDYHNCAVCMVIGTGMHRADTMRPIFWRTPGYPLYLSWFYKQHGFYSPQFSPNRPAHLAALWLQILLSSLVPLFIFALIYLLVGILPIAWLTAWISVFHIGNVLASGYLLTEALALVFFVPYLIFFYKSFRIWTEGKPITSSWVFSIILSAFFLGIMAWIRPMGEFVAILSAMFICVLDNATWNIKFKKAGLFLLVFFAVTGGWYLRNYALTGKLFFCPMFGPYLNSFCAPKILRDTTNLSLENCIRMQYKKAVDAAQKDNMLAQRKGKIGCREQSALRCALPIIKKHPVLFVRGWIKEVLKTTFDLHTSQLVGFVKNTFMYDPLEEFLTEKWRDCTYRTAMPLWMRLLTFLEIIFELLKWIGLLFGAWMFMFSPLLKRFAVSKKIKKTGLLWFKTSLMIGALLFMTGGFGYARLRLPAEPLMIMLSLTFWYWVFYKKENKKQKKLF